MKENQLSWVLAILIHIIFICLFILMKINFPLRLEVENIEVIAIDQFMNIEDDSKQSAHQSPSSSQSEASAISAQSKISLPISSHNYEDVIKVSSLPMKREKQINQHLLNDQIDESFGNSQSLKPNSDQKIKTSVSGNGNSQYINSLGKNSGGSSEGTSSFSLEGEVINRQLIRKKVPEYPEGMMKDGTVSLKFTVLPDGSVSDIVIIKKSDPIFENLSISSLNQWKFNRSDKKNTGIISFHFKIE